MSSDNVLVARCIGWLSLFHKQSNQDMEDDGRIRRKHYTKKMPSHLKIALLHSNNVYQDT